MNWQGKAITDLTDAELLETSKSVSDMETNDSIKRKSDKYKKLMENRVAPWPNPAFIALKTEIDNELKKRNNP